MTTTLENRSSLPAACVKPREGYKETNLYFLNNGCILQTNNDIPFTEETRLALAWIAYIERCRRIDEIVKKWQSGRKCCRRGKKINKSTRKKKDHINQISQLLRWIYRIHKKALIKLTIESHYKSMVSLE